MKKIITYMFYYMGDLVSRSFFFRYGWGYTLYNKLMIKSVKLQDKWKLAGPWQHVENNDI